MMYQPSKLIAVRWFTVMLVCAAIAAVVSLVIGSYQSAQKRVNDIEPRYARMLGLQKQRSELDAAVIKAQELRGKYVYTSSQDSAQTGNTAQQRVRDIFGSAGLQIVSSQVLPAKLEAGMEVIPIAVRSEGNLLALQTVLAVLSSQSPAILLNELDIQSQNFASTGDKMAAHLFVNFNLTVLREPS